MFTLDDLSVLNVSVVQIGRLVDNVNAALGYLTYSLHSGHH